MKVITYQSPHGGLIDLSLAQVQMLEREGRWPRDSFGSEYCSVHHGEHEGDPNMSDLALRAYVGLELTRDERIDLVLERAHEPALDVKDTAHGTVKGSLREWLRHERGTDQRRQAWEELAAILGPKRAEVLCTRFEREVRHV